MYTKYIKYISIYLIYYICHIYCIDNIELSKLLKDNVPSNEAIETLRKELKDSVERNHNLRNELVPILSNPNCENCTNRTEAYQSDEHKIFVFMSFSVPDSVWLSLSKELKEVGGVFVIRGLPNNNFRTLSTKMLELVKNGVEVPVELDPLKFRKFNIVSVPSFVMNDGEKYNKISGNITLKYALEKLGGES